jgi:deoxyribodipyrimidine photo-lyase
MIHWQVGERWFWEHLIDASPANNAFNWQWSAGSGADAAPFFRIFNPVLQSKKFDPQGEYIRRWVPELSQLPDSTLHTPWKASSSICKAIHFIPGTTYPDPIVDLAESRKIALDTLRAVNQPDNFPPLA